MKNQAHLDTLLATIARDELNIETLDERGRDHLDFHDCGVAGIRAALARAFAAGQASKA